jgi:SAM-dependent methyltransferase
MKLVPIDPPGTICAHAAITEVVRRTGPRTFVDVGCGRGRLSKTLCSLGMTGYGVDVSPRAIEATMETLSAEIAGGRYALLEADATALDGDLPPVDLAISLMVMEHVHDDVGFVRTLRRLVRPDGWVAVGVPGRRDKWSFEDETVGHLRRYERDDVRTVLEAGGLRDVEVWSIAVPTANILLHLGTALVRACDEARHVGLGQREQTETSGLREIPWKTVFPPWMKVVLNRHMLWPLCVLQRCFYRTGLGVTMLGFGHAPDSGYLGESRRFR